MIINSEKIKKYAQDKQIKFIILFGSAALENLHPESDYDIAISLYNQRPLFRNLKEHSEILNQLGDILRIDPDKIDLVDLNGANILLRFEITSKGKLLYGDEVQFIQYQCFAYRDCVDAKALFDLENSIIHKRQKFLKTVLQSH